MTGHPLFVLTVLGAIEILVLSLSLYPRTKGWFDVIPSVFWIYFLPMMASTAGLLDPKALILGVITTNVLPMALFLLLVSVDVRAILRLGGKAVGLFFIGSAGIMAGALLAYAVVKNIVGLEMWGGFAALSASWTGGSANMIAVKEALAVPDRVFLPMVVVDTVCPYVWMGLLIAASRLQLVYDAWSHADRSVLEQLRLRTRAKESDAAVLSFPGILFLLVSAFFVGLVAQYAAQHLPRIKDVIGVQAWTIIVVSMMGLGLSFTRARELENHGATKVGYWLLYLVLTAIGAKAAVSNLGASVILIAAGFLIVVVHAVFLLVGGRLLRAPLFLLAAASQANIGGVASAPVVAAVYEPGLASVGLLLAILGNIVGTYLGIICGQLCRLF